jgi:hypothetical protein
MVCSPFPACAVAFGPRHGKHSHNDAADVPVFSSACQPLSHNESTHSQSELVQFYLVVLSPDLKRLMVLS